MEDELVDLGIRHLFEFGFRGQTTLQNLRFHLLDIDALTVVTDLDDDVTTLMIGGKSDDTLFRLAGGAALLGALQTVVGRIADHMRQRILDHLKNLTVQFCIGTDHFQFDRFRQFLAQIAHDARQFLPGIADRLHAGRHDPFLQLRSHV